MDLYHFCLGCKRLELLSQLIQLNIAVIFLFLGIGFEEVIAHNIFFKTLKFSKVGLLVKTIIDLFDLIASCACVNQQFDT